MHLIEQGHSIIVIEHNTDVIKSADWVIDLGPEAGDGGGNLVYAGMPTGLKKIKESYTGKYLKSESKYQELGISWIAISQPPYLNRLLSFISFESL